MPLPPIHFPSHRLTSVSSGNGRNGWKVLLCSSTCYGYKFTWLLTWSLSTGCSPVRSNRESSGISPINKHLLMLCTQRTKSSVQHPRVKPQSSRLNSLTLRHIVCMTLVRFRHRKHTIRLKRTLLSWVLCVNLLPDSEDSDGLTLQANNTKNH